MPAWNFLCTNVISHRASRIDFAVLRNLRLGRPGILVRLYYLMLLWKSFLVTFQRKKCFKNFFQNFQKWEKRERLSAGQRKKRPIRMSLVVFYSWRRPVGNGQKVRFGKTLSDVRIPNRQRRQAVGPLTIYFDNFAGLVYLGLKIPFRVKFLIV